MTTKETEFSVIPVNQCLKLWFSHNWISSIECVYANG